MRIVAVGDSLIVLEAGDRIDPQLNVRVIALADRLAARAIPGVRDIVPTYASVGVHFDPTRTDLARLERVMVEESQAETSPVTAAGAATLPTEIAVRYGGEAGPDLEEVAAWASCSVAEVVARHAAVVYRVYMLGFVPGFAYMGDVDPTIAMPRRSAPRPLVPSGSVAIAGRQTGVYPTATPGGWRIIGRTDASLFALDRSPASLLKAGDRVRFVPAQAGT